MPIRREIYSPAISCTVNSTYPSSEVGDRLNLNIGSDFKLVYQFTDSRYSPALLIPMDSFDIKIEYYVKGKPEVYQVVKKGMSVINCIINESTSELKAIFDNHGLGTGLLYSRFTFYFPDIEFPDRVGSVVSVEDTGITLVDNLY